MVYMNVSYADVLLFIQVANFCNINVLVRKDHPKMQYDNLKWSVKIWKYTDFNAAEFNLL